MTRTSYEEIKFGFGIYKMKRRGWYMDFVISSGVVVEASARGDSRSRTMLSKFSFVFSFCWKLENQNFEKIQKWEKIPNVIVRKK